MLRSFRKIFGPDLVLTAIFAHGFAKFFFSAGNKYSLKYIFFIPLQIMFTLVSFFIVFALLIIFATYKECVCLYLKLKYSNDFHSMMDGTGALFTTTTNPIVFGVFVYECKKNGSPEKLYQRFVECMKRMVEANPILSTVLCCECGHYFHKRIDFDINSVVRPLTGYKDGKEFNEWLNRANQQPFTFDNHFLWDVKVGQVPINWPNTDENNAKTQIPVIFRYNHILADAFTFFTLSTAYFFDDSLKAVQIRNKEYEYAIARSKLIGKSIWEKMNEYPHKEFVLRTLRDQETEHALHSNKSSSKKCVAYALDTEDGKCLRTMKEIKRRIAGVTFMDILFTAISASFEQYLRKTNKNEVWPKSILCAAPHFMHLPNYESFVNVDDPANLKIKLTNKFSVGYYVLPICDQTLSNNVYKRLLAIKEESKLISNSLDIPLFMWLASFISEIVPKCVVCLLRFVTDGSVILTNITGHCSLDVNSEFTETDNLFWSTNYNKIGITISFFCYDNKVRITMMHDKNVIAEGDGQAILEQFFVNVDKLDQATRLIQ